ncbi:MAG: DUF262 domain-containing protein [Bacteroidales bacterium]|nr:DUF262 domain-containing protein [Bacteroidales bacterium]
MSDIQFDKSFRPLPVSEILTKPYRFIIPSFQRGYRWERKQVTDLLDDIFSFSAGEQTSYFLQPLVVKASGEPKNNEWEVLDGQQRLTTMLLILIKIISRMGDEDKEEYKDSLYEIKYLIRPNLDFKNPDPKQTIDGFYLAEAKNTIDRWFDAKRKAHADLDGIKKCLFHPDSSQQVKFIWYEISPDSNDLSSINVFNRLNKGKIGLTGSELIKALFVLDLENNGDQDNTASGQLVMEWNEMERKFQNDNFWYFISNEDRAIQTRIDLLFDFLTQKTNGEDSDYSYRLFQNLFDYCNAAKGANVVLNPFWSTIKVDNMKTAWRQIKKTFNSLVAWYEDNMFYHYVGFLVNEKSSPLSIFNSLQEAKSVSARNNPSHEWTRDDSEKTLKGLIREKFKASNAYLTRDGINKLEYGDSERVRRVLLLFNIELCIKTGNQRFSFDCFKKEKWDIEHVDSQNDSDLQKPEERILWLRNILMILQMEQCKTPLLEECSSLIQEYDKQVEGERTFSNELYASLYKKVNQYFSFDSTAGDSSIDLVDLSNKNKDSINNLTLLNSDINRSYKDAPFPYKRYFIIQQDQEGGHFIPIGTRNLFLKYYSNSKNSSSSLDLMRWNEADKDSYLDFIHSIVDHIIDP